MLYIRNILDLPLMSRSRSEFSERWFLGRQRILISQGIGQPDCTCAVLLEAVAPEGASGGPLRGTSLDAKIWSLFLDDGLAVHVTVYAAVALDELDDDVPLTLQIEIETLHGTLFAVLSPRQAWSLAEHLRDAAIAREAA